MASFFQKWIDLIIRTSSISYELLEVLMVQMAGTIFVVFYSFFVFQEVSTMIVIKPFPTIIVFLYFNHIIVIFPFGVYRACTLFTLHLILQLLFLLPLGISVNMYSKSSQLLYVLIFLLPLECLFPY